MSNKAEPVNIIVDEDNKSPKNSGKKNNSIPDDDLKKSNNSQENKSNDGKKQSENSDDDDDDDEDEDGNEKQQNAKIAGQVASADSQDDIHPVNNQLSETDTTRLNYYRWMFFFFFFHFFTFICTTDILNEFSIYLDNEKVYNEFTEKYPNIITCIQMLLTFNVFVIIAFIATFVLTFRYELKVYHILLGSFGFLYLGKFICIILSSVIEPDMNSYYSEFHTAISDDEDQKRCGYNEYEKCRFTYAWNFFKYEIIFDAVVTTLVFGVYIFKSRVYKIQLIKEYFQLQDQEEDPDKQSHQSKVISRKSDDQKSGENNNNDSGDNTAGNPENKDQTKQPNNNEKLEQSWNDISQISQQHDVSQMQLQQN